MVSYERGPLDMFRHLRRFLGIQEGESGPESWPDKPLTNLVTCPWCLGVWMTAGMYGVWQLEPTIVLVIAAAALVPLFERAMHHG